MDTTPPPHPPWLASPLTLREFEKFDKIGKKFTIIYEKIKFPDENGYR
jgi:hypothetical protein